MKHWSSEKYLSLFMILMSGSSGFALDTRKFSHVQSSLIRVIKEGEDCAPQDFDSSCLIRKPGSQLSKA